VETQRTTISTLKLRRSDGSSIIIKMNNVIKEFNFVFVAELMKEWKKERKKDEHEREVIVF
jgi:hypothetical protein